MPEVDIEIRKLSIQDAAFLHAIATQAYSEHYSTTWYDGGEWYLKTYFSITQLQAELLDANALFFAVYYRQEPVGFLKLNLCKPLCKYP